METQRIKRWRTRTGAELAVATGMGLFLGLAGPFGTYFNGPAWQRIGYWTAMGWLGMASFQLCRPALLRQARSGRRLALGLAATTLLITVATGVVSWFLARTVWPVLWRLPELTPGVWFFQSLTITAPEVALFAWLGWVGPNSVPSAPRPAIVNVLQARPSEVLCLQMEDHYVRVHTAGGSRLVLATMSQAMVALQSAPGLRVHRSWWVAEAAVAGAVEQGRRVKLVLTNGLQTPVARSAVAQVRARGWLARQVRAAA